MAKAKNTTPTEFQECRTLVQYLDLRGFKYSHLAQSTFTKSWSQMAKNKAMGVHRGVPDYLIILPNGILLFLEMKREKGGSLSDDQEEWIAELNTINDGVKAVVCEGAGEAIAMIEILLKPLTPESF